MAVAQDVSRVRAKHKTPSLVDHNKASYAQVGNPVDAKPGAKSIATGKKMPRAVRSDHEP